MKNELLRVLKYLYSPSITNKPETINIYNILSLAIFYIIATIVSNIFIKIYLFATNVTYSIPLLEEHYYPFVYIVILVGIIAPIKEEIQFRLLLKPNRHNIFLFYMTIILTSIILLYYGQTMHAIIYLFFLIVLSLLIYKKTKTLKKFYYKYFRILFYISILLFGFLHITNYEGKLVYLLLGIPILTLPQLILGSILGFIRMKYGFIYAIAFHIINNIFVLLTLYRNSAIKY